MSSVRGRAGRIGWVDTPEAVVPALRETMGRVAAGRVDAAKPDERLRTGGRRLFRTIHRASITATPTSNSTTHQIMSAPLPLDYVPAAWRRASMAPTRYTRIAPAAPHTYRMVSDTAT